METALTFLIWVLAASAALPVIAGIIVGGLILYLFITDQL